MTIQTDTNRADYTGNGVTTTFPVPFRFLENAHLLVIRTIVATGAETTLTLDALGSNGYTVTGAATPNGGTVTLNTAPANLTEKLSILLNVPATQLIDYIANDPFPAETHERGLDKLTLLIKQLKEVDQRALRVPLSSTANGQLPALVPLAPIVVDASGTGFGMGDFSGVGDLLLRGDLASAATGKGSALVNFNPGTANDVDRTIQAKLRDHLTVEDYGAVGDGVTNDSAAFINMATDNAGTIRMLDKEYFVGTLSLSGFSNIKIQGRRMPKKNATVTKLIDGTVFVGRVNIVCNDVIVENFGVDCGSGRGAIGITEGFVIDAKPGELGNQIVIRNIACNGASSANPTHALLFEGYESVDVDTVYVANHRYGVVCKSRNGRIVNVDADTIDVAAVYAKGDLPANAGNVANAKVSNIQISNVIHRAAVGNTTASAAYLHASTDSVAGVQVVNVNQTRGHSPLRIQGSGVITDPAISGIVAQSINSDTAQYGCYAAGYAYDIELSDIKAVNPVTGEGLETSSVVSAWKADGIHVLISDAGNLSTNCASLAGTGQWDNFVVRNPARTMTITQATTSYATIRAGQYSGDCIINGEANLTFVNLVGAGAPTPRLRINSGSVIELAGQLNCAVATGTAGLQAAVLPVSVTGPRVFRCAAVDNLGAQTSINVLVNGTAVSPQTVYTGWQWIDLSGIVFRF